MSYNYGGNDSNSGYSSNSGNVSIIDPIPSGTNNIGIVEVSNDFALNNTLTDGNQISIIKGGSKGSTIASIITSTNQGTHRQGLDVQIRDSSGSAIDTFGGGQQYADGATRGTATGTLLMVDDGTNIQSVAGTSGGLLKVDLSGTSSNSTAVKVDGSAVTQPVSNADMTSTATALSNLVLTQDQNTSGQKGVLLLGAASTSHPSYTENKTNPLSLNLNGEVRMSNDSIESSGNTTTSNIGELLH